MMMAKVRRRPVLYPCHCISPDAAPPRSKRCVLGPQPSCSAPQPPRPARRGRPATRSFKALASRARAQTNCCMQCFAVTHLGPRLHASKSSLGRGASAVLAAEQVAAWGPTRERVYARSESSELAQPIRWAASSQQQGLVASSPHCVAGLILSGLGGGLQIRRGLAAQPFDSA